MIRAATFGLLVALALSVAACGGADGAASTGSGHAAEAEPVPEGDDVRLAGLDYRVTLARQINPSISPGEQWYQGPGAPPGSLLFAVFLQVCNRTDEAHVAAEAVRLVGPFETLRPMDLPEDDVFAYEGGRLAPERCTPDPGSAAQRAAGGGMLLFEMPREVLRVPQPSPRDPGTRLARVGAGRGRRLTPMGVRPRPPHHGGRHR